MELDETYRLVVGHFEWRVLGGLRCLRDLELVMRRKEVNAEDRKIGEFVKGHTARDEILEE